MRCQCGHRAGGQAQPAQLRHHLRHQRCVGIVLARRCLGVAQGFHQGVELLRGQPQALKKPRELPQGAGLYLPAFDQAGEVEAALHIDDLAGEEGFRGVGAGIVHLGHVAVCREEGGQACLLQRNGPGLSQVVGATGTAVGRKNEP